MHSIDTAAQIGEHIRQARTAQELRQEELALVAQVSTRAVHQIESGKVTSRLDVIVKVLDALGLTLEVVAAPRVTGPAHDRKG